MDAGVPIKRPVSGVAMGLMVDVEKGAEITAKDIDDYLGNLPKHKFHCSVLGHDALRDAINNYRSKK